MGRSTLLGYHRKSLQGASETLEEEFTGIDPEWFYRCVKRSIEEIQEGRRFKYRTRGTHRRDLRFDWEPTGPKTCSITGRLMAVSGSSPIGNGCLQYRPYPRQGMVVVVIGIILVTLGFWSASILSVIGIAALFGGVWLWFRTEIEEVPITGETVIHVYMTGQASERSEESDNPSQTDVVANENVVFAADLYLEVDADAVPKLDRQLRRSLGNQVDDWYNRLVGDERKIAPDQGPVADLTGRLTGNGERSRRSIFSRQRALKNDVVTRRRYSALVEEVLADPVQRQVVDQHHRLADELDALSEKITSTVERERISA